VPDPDTDAGVGEFSGQNVLAVAGALHPAPNGRLHRISLAIFFENVFTAPPPGDSGRAKAIVWASELGILVREKSFGDHALAVRSRDIGDLRTPFQGRQSIFLANLIDRLENALLDGLRMLRIARDEHEKRNEVNPNHGLSGARTLALRGARSPACLVDTHVDIILGAETHNAAALELRYFVAIATRHLPQLYSFPACGARAKSVAATAALAGVPTRHTKVCALRLVARRLLEDRRHSPLRICHHRHAAHAFDAHRLDVESSAELFGLRGRGIHIGRREIDQPVRRRMRIAMLRRRNAADKVLAVLDVQISRRIFFPSHQLPSEKS
jgi:hypothetical protein